MGIKHEWFKMGAPVILAFAVVALIRSFAFDAISDNPCANVKDIPQTLSGRQQKEFCHCRRKTGDYYISHAAVKRIKAGEGRPDDYERYNRLFKLTCEENALKVSESLW